MLSKKAKKGKDIPYSLGLPSVGPGADPGVQAVSPQVTISQVAVLLYEASASLSVTYITSTIPSPMYPSILTPFTSVMKVTTAYINTF